MKFLSNQFPLLLMPHFKQGNTPIHTHDFTEIVIINSGKGIHYNQKETYQLKKGDVFVIRGNTAHGYQKCQELKITNILFDETTLNIPLWDLRTLAGYQSLFHIEPIWRHEHSIQSSLNLDFKKLKIIENIITQLNSELNEKKMGYQYSCISLLMKLIISLCRSYQWKLNNEILPHHKMANILSYMEKNYSQAISQDDLAKIGHISKSTLQRIFAQTFQVSPIDYLIEIRLEAAKTLLCQTNFNMTEIAFKNGFNDANYFSRKFKEKYSISPLQYRKQMLDKKI